MAHSYGFGGFSFSFGVAFLARDAFGGAPFVPVILRMFCRLICETR